MTRSSLPDIRKILKTNPDKWFTYQDIASVLNIHVSNINKLITKLVKENFVIKMETRPVIFKLKDDRETMTGVDIDQILQKFLINVQEELIKLGFKVSSYAFQERHLKIDMGFHSKPVKFHISWSY